MKMHMIMKYVVIGGITKPPTFSIHVYSLKYIFEIQLAKS